MECVITKDYQTSSRIMFLFLEDGKQNLSALFSTLSSLSGLGGNCEVISLEWPHSTNNSLTKPPAKDENASLIFPSDSSDTILRMLQIILK